MMIMMIIAALTAVLIAVLVFLFKQVVLAYQDGDKWIAHSQGR
jgi:nitrogen fixation-related uncharacterized protein